MHTFQTSNWSGSRSEEGMLLVDASLRPITYIGKPQGMNRHPHFAARVGPGTDVVMDVAAIAAVDGEEERMLVLMDDDAGDRGGEQGWQWENGIGRPPERPATAPAARLYFLLSAFVCILAVLTSPAGPETQTQGDTDGVALGQGRWEHRYVARCTGERERRKRPPTGGTTAGGQVSGVLCFLSFSSFTHPAM